MPENASRADIRWEVVDDSFRNMPLARAGRPPSAETQALIDGKTVFVPGHWSDDSNRLVSRRRSYFARRGLRVRQRSGVVNGVAGVVYWVE